MQYDSWTDVPAGEYYLFSSVPNGTNISNYRAAMKKDGVSVANNSVTNGTFYAFKSTNKITISADCALTVSVTQD